MQNERIRIMKATGIILLIVGLLMTVYLGFTYVTKEKVADLGSIQITNDKDHNVHWHPYVGVGVMVIGGAVLLLSRKRALVA